MAAANVNELTPLLCTPSIFRQHGPVVEQMMRSGDHTLYPHQIEAVLNLKEMFQKDKEQNIVRPAVVVTPTGSGKSGMAVLAPYILGAQKVLILTPSKNISNQMARTFGKSRIDSNFFENCKLFTKEEQFAILEPVTLIQKASDITDNLSNCIIVNAQRFSGKSKTTLNMKYQNEVIVENVNDFFSEPDLLIVDEAHHFPAPTWKRIAETFTESESPLGLQKKMVFMTATPYRTGPNGKDIPILPDLQNRIAYEGKRSEMEGNCIRKISFVEKKDDERLARDIRKILKKQSDEEPRFQPQAIVKTRTKEEAVKYETILNEANNGSNYAAAIIRGRKGIDEEQLKRDFDEGRIRVAIVCGLLIEGYDNPKITLCVILEKIKNKGRFAQFIGRCNRMHMGLSGEEKDRTNAKILSYWKFEQDMMWEDYEELATTDPVE